MWDERFSTTAVERAMVDSGVKRRISKKMLTVPLRLGFYKGFLID